MSHKLPAHLARGQQVSLRGQTRNIPPEIPSPGSGTDQSSEPCDGVCAKIMLSWGRKCKPAFPLLSTNSTETPASSLLQIGLPAVSDYFTISHERVGDVRTLADPPAKQVPHLPYEICCVCETCHQHRQSIKDSKWDFSAPPIVPVDRPPSMAPIFRHPHTPNRFLTCPCSLCDAHLEAIDQLAEKVARGAEEEMQYWTGMSLVDIIVSDWQDISGKKQQAYWSYKALMDLAIRRDVLPLVLEPMLRVIEAFEAVTVLPIGLTRQVKGETLDFDQILQNVFSKCIIGVNAEASRAFDRGIDEEICHRLLLLADTLNIYAHSFPVESRPTNVASVTAIRNRIRNNIPEAFLNNHTFTGIRFDETKTAWTETRPVVLPRSIPINHSRRDATQQSTSTSSGRSS